MMTINDRIKAVHVLQRFVIMSRTLLPNLSELMSKENLTENEEDKLDRIRDIYDSFRADSEVSEVLVNSNIFQLIKDVYSSFAHRQGLTPQRFYLYDQFLKESDRLIENWNRQQLN